MARVVHEIDPDADTLIVLRSTKNSFSPWDENDNGQVQTDVPLKPELDDMWSPRMSSKMHKRQRQSHFRVSSRHLMLASPWFKRAMTKEGWSESSRSQEDGLFHVRADDWDAEAFLILLNIIHLRNKKVPRTISLVQLAKIAVLVDYYECEEVMEMFLDVWSEPLKASAPIPLGYCRDLVLWIFVSWTFGLGDSFEQATAVAIDRSKKTLSTLDLPIPAKVLAEIDLKRYQAIESVIEQLHALLDEYRAATYACPQGSNFSFQCGSYLLGALTKEMDRMQLLSPRPEVPFPNLSFDDICNKVKATNSSSWAHGNSNGFYSGSQHFCKLSTRVTGIVTKAASAVTGLSLSQTKQRKASNS